MGKNPKENMREKERELKGREKDVVQVNVEKRATSVPWKELLRESHVSGCNSWLQIPVLCTLKGRRHNKEQFLPSENPCGGSPSSGIPSETTQP